MAFADGKPPELCCICQGNVPTWMDGNATTAQTPWGEFTIYYHPPCYNKEIVEGKLRKMVEEARPKEDEE